MELNSLNIGPSKSREKASRYAILGMLNFGNKSGYDIKKAIAASTANFWRESDGNIYPALKKLVEEKAVRPVSSKETSGRQRQVYKITDAGRVALREWLVQPTAPRSPDSEFLLKLFFSSILEPREALHLIQAHAAQQSSQLELYRQLAKSIEQHPASQAQRVYWSCALNYGITVNGAILQWCKETESQIHSLIVAGKQN
jgi:PadR family transcriptional regulator, regulatory protein AphA